MIEILAGTLIDPHEVARADRFSDEVYGNDLQRVENFSTSQSRLLSGRLFADFRLDYSKGIRAIVEAISQLVGEAWGHVQLRVSVVVLNTRRGLKAICVCPPALRPRWWAWPGAACAVHGDDRGYPTQPSHQSVLRTPQIAALRKN